MLHYSDFLLEKQLQLISESVVYFSPKLKEEIIKVKSPISRALLEIDGEDIKDDITFLDYTEQEGFITYKTMKTMLKQLDDSTLDDELKKILKEVEIKSPKSSLSANFLANKDIPDNIRNIYLKSRNPIKLGRLINTLLPNKFTPQEIEKFANKFKALQRGESLTTVRVVEGDEIAKWYHEDNYLESKHTLGTSCMRRGTDRYFKIYTQNPEVCKMVCSFAEDEYGVLKLTGRALLWKPIVTKGESGFEWFMDRQYGISDAEIENLRNWAEKEGYAYKTNNSHSSFFLVNYKGETSKCRMKVELQEQDYSSFPFMDTFRRYDPETYTLYNDDEREFGGQYILNSTGGYYEEINIGNYSSWYEENIPEEFSVYSEPLDDYLWEGRSIYVGRGSRNLRGYWPEDHDDIVYDAWNKDYIHINDAIHSDYYDGWILSDESIDVVDWIGKNGNCGDEPSYIHENDSDYIRMSQVKDTFWFEHLSSKRNFNWEYRSGILKSLLNKDWKGNWILKDFQIELYEVEGDDFDMEYLDKGVFTTLDRDDIKLSEETQVWDVFEYLNEVDVNFDLKLIEQKLNDLLVNLTSKEGSIRQDCKKLLEFIKVY